MLRFYSMIGPRPFLFSVFLIAVAVFGAGGQSLRAESRFVSVYGNFSINLSETPNLTRGVRNDDAPDKGKGMIYAWEQDNVVYTALYLDPLETAGAPTDAESAADLEENNQNVRATITKYEGRIVSERPLTLGKLSGTEIRAQLGAGLLIARNFQVGRRKYSIQAVVRDPADETKALGILVSFKLIDGRALIDKKINEITPAPFPPKPPVKMPKSDVETAKLRGKIATVVEESEDLTGDAAQQGRIFAAEYFYDAKGFQTKEIRYDAQGRPAQIAVFGFVDKALVARLGAARDGAQTSNAKYDLKIRYVFDPAGRVTETKYFRGGGGLNSRTLAIYNENRTEIQTFNEQGELMSKTFLTFDAQNNPIESVIQTFKPKNAEYKTVYKYETFDKNGNWTKRTLSEWRTENGTAAYVPVRLEYRTLTFYDAPVR